MKGRLCLAFAMCLFVAAPSAGAPILLYEVGFNIDGTTYSTVGGDPIDNEASPLPDPPFDSTGFDFTTGLGEITLQVTGAGSHFVIGYFDLEYEDLTNSRFNEIGSVLNLGSKPGNLSWELGDPFVADAGAFPSGVYYNAFKYDQLANANNSTNPNDVAVALGWTLTLSPGETALLSFVVSPSAPGGFALRQFDPQADADVAYYHSTLSIEGGEVIPEPATWLLLGTGLALLRRRACR